MKLAPRTRVIGVSALLALLLLGLAVTLVASAPSLGADAKGHHRKHHEPTPPPHHQPTPLPSPAGIVAAPNPVILSSDGTARAYFVLVGTGLTPGHTYSIFTNVACSWQNPIGNPAIADLDGHIQVSAPFSYCLPGTYYVVAVDPQGGPTYSTTITLLPPTATLPSMAKNATSK